MNLLYIVIFGLVVYRLSRLISREDGPLNILKSFRSSTGRWASDLNPVKQSIADLIHCPYCNAIWISGFVSLFISDSVTDWFIYTFAISGVQCVLQVLEDK